MIALLTLKSSKAETASVAARTGTAVNSATAMSEVCRPGAILLKRFDRFHVGRFRQVRQIGIDVGDALIRNHLRRERGHLVTRRAELLEQRGKGKRRIDPRPIASRALPPRAVAGVAAIFHEVRFALLGVARGRRVFTRG